MGRRRPVIHGVFTVTETLPTLKTTTPAPVQTFTGYGEEEHEPIGQVFKAGATQSCKCRVRKPGTVDKYDVYLHLSYVVETPNPEWNEKSPPEVPKVNTRVQHERWHWSDHWTAENLPAIIAVFNSLTQ